MNQQHDLVELIELIPTLVLDIRYATTNNFTHQKLYPSARAFLRRPAALALKKVQEELLANYKLKLKVWDAYRPWQVQYKLWEIMPNSPYVMNPDKGSRHNRGCAVDVTLVTLDGKELPMPTEFDNFTEQAHSDYQDLPAEVLKNRELLRTIMEKHGFKVVAVEWWHFDYIGWQNYPLLDIPFDAL